MRALLGMALCSVLALDAFAADPLPSVVNDWIRANNTSKEVQREQIIDNTVAVDFVSSSMDGLSLGDRDSFKLFMRGAHKAFSDYRLDVLDSAKQGNRIWLRIKASGTHVGPLMGIDPSGTKISVGLVVILEIENEKITREWQMSDVASLQRQLSTPQTGD